MKKQLNEVKKMQQLAGIKINLNESIEGYGDIQSLNEIDSSGIGTTKEAKAIGKWAAKNGLSQEKYDILESLIDDWYYARQNELDAGSDW
jgi:hypothetical protein